jgi:membrane fusion protein, multidrug efflux system
MVHSRHTGVRFAVVLTAIVVGSYVAWHYAAANRQADVLVGASATPSPGVGSAPIPVTIASGQTADFPVYLNGLGTVQPYRTVTVRSRVDGQIVKVDFRQGRMVQEGDILVEIDPRPYKAALDQALAKKVQDEANLANAKLDLDRYISLKDAATRQQVDTQRAMVDQLTAQVAGDQAAIENAQTLVDYTTIKAPLSGRAGFRTVDPGNIVHASDQTGIVTIVQLQPISVVFTAPEEDVQLINKALEGDDVPVKALSSDGLRILAEGQLALVNNEVDQATGTIGMKATFANKDNVLWPGLSVSTRLLVDTLKQVVVVPDDAVQRGPDGLYAGLAAQHGHEWRPAPAGQHPPVVRRFARPLGGRHAGDRRDQLQSQDRRVRIAREPAPGRALHAHGAEHTCLRGHDRRSDGVDQGLDHQAGVHQAER